MSESGGAPDLPALSVVPDEVRAVGHDILDTAKTFRDALHSAAGEVDDLTTHGWTGPAADTFATGWGEVQDGGGKVIDALTTLASELGVTAANYQAVDQAISSTLTADDIPRSNW